MHTTARIYITVYILSILQSLAGCSIGVRVNSTFIHGNPSSFIYAVPTQTVLNFVFITHNLTFLARHIATYTRSHHEENQLMNVDTDTLPRQYQQDG